MPLNTPLLLDFKHIKGEEIESESSTRDSGAETPHDSFEFVNFHSEFAEVFGLNTQ